MPKNESKDPDRYLYIHTYSSIMHSGQKVETIQNLLMNEWTKQGI